MKKRTALLILLIPVLCFCSPGPKAGDKNRLLETVVAGLPDYQDFLTVDELQQFLQGLKERNRELVTLNVVGRTELGNPILELKIGQGTKHALLFGFPHPNEPIGSLMLCYLAEELSLNKRLRDYYDFTWHIVPCADPDKARINEGWFKGKLTLTKYARNYYRPPMDKQVEWTFPVSCKKYKFSTPTPEAQALMKIIDNNTIDFSFGLHNSDFGGVYFYWSQDVPSLYPALYDFVSEQGLPLHLGEPEVPYGIKFDKKSMFRMLYFRDGYDYMEKYSPTPPEEILTSGESSDDYIKDKYNSLTVNSELPYFYDPRIEDTTLSDLTRAEAVLKSLDHEKALFLSLKDKYQEVEPLLTSRSLFVDTIEEVLRTGENDISTAENAVRTESEYNRRATIAEKWDALNLRKFQTLLYVGQFIRLLEHEKARVGAKFPAALQKILDENIAEFDQRAAEAESALSYKVTPIKKLASVQLLTALYAMDYVQRH
jgi:hypothetical protein